MEGAAQDKPQAGCARGPLQNRPSTNCDTWAAQEHQPEAKAKWRANMTSDSA